MNESGQREPAERREGEIALEAWRSHRNLTQRALASRAGLAVTTVNEIEALKRKAHPRTIRRLAHALNTDEQSLYTLPPSDREQVPQILSIADLLNRQYPRSVVVTERRWMEPYHSLEEGELGHRLKAARDHSYAFDLWLRALALYRSSFNGIFDWGDDLPAETVNSLNLRAGLLGLAGSTSKPALDGLLAGYYWSTFGLIRNLLETWRRAAYVRLQPEEAAVWFELPSESPVGQDGQRQKGSRILTYKRIAAAIQEYGSDEDQFIFDLVNAGIVHCHGGAHPSPEGLMQLQSEEDGKRVFGPNYIRPLCAFALKWGLFAHLVLLREVTLLRPQTPDWISSFNALGDRYAAWQKMYNEEFLDADFDDSRSADSMNADEHVG